MTCDPDDMLPIEGWRDSCACPPETLPLGLGPHFDVLRDQVWTIYHRVDAVQFQNLFPLPRLILHLRNGMLGGDYSTKLAPWLAAGCISPRTIYHQVSREERSLSWKK